MKQISDLTIDEERAADVFRALGNPARLRIVRELVSAGIPTSVNIAPVIPGLTDWEIPRLLEAAADAGAQSVAWVMLRLPYQLKDLFLDWLKRSVHPDRARHVESLIRQMRGGKLYEADFRVRGRGRGDVAEQIARVFKVFKKKHGLEKPWEPLNTMAFRRPVRDVQMNLFG